MIPRGIICTGAGILFAALFITSARADTTYYVTGGDLTNWLFWNISTAVDFPDGKPGVTFDNGEPANQGGISNVNDYTYQIGSSLPDVLLPRQWLIAGAPAFTGLPANFNPVPANFNTTYSGTITTDDAGNVIGGTFVSTGRLAYHLDLFGQSLMMPELIDVSWNLSTGIATGTTNCHLGDLAAQLSPIFCNAAVISEYNLVAGQEGVAGPARPAATFDPLTGGLAFFAEGFDNQQVPNSFNIDNAFTFTVTTTLQPPFSANLAVSQTVSADPVVPGGALSYDVEVSNDGPSAATGVVLTDTLPTGSAFSSASAGCLEASGVVTCAVGDLAISQTKSLHIAVTAPAVEGNISNNISVTGDQGDPDTGDNSAALASRVSASAAMLADLAVSQTVSANQVAPGGALTYDIHITNAGPDAATGVMVTTTLPAGSAFATASPGCTEASGVVTCSLDDLAVSALQSRQIVITAPFVEGTITNTVSVTGDQSDPDTIDNDSALASLVSSVISVEVGSSSLGWAEIVLLGLLALLRTSNQRRSWASGWLSMAVAACGLFSFAPSPTLAAGLVWYAGAAAGQSSVDMTASDVIDALTTSNTTISSVIVDDSATGWKIFQGGTYGRYFGAELAYVDLGETGASFQAETTDIDELLQNSAEFLPTQVSGVVVTAIARYPIADRLAVFGKIGGLYWESEANASLTADPSSKVAFDDDGVDITWGFGAEFYFLKFSWGKLGIRAEWERYEPGGRDVDFTSGALLVRFGQ